MPAQLGAVAFKFHDMSNYVENIRYPIMGVDMLLTRTVVYDCQGLTRYMPK